MANFLGERYGMVDIVSTDPTLDPTGTYPPGTMVLYKNPPNPDILYIAGATGVLSVVNFSSNQTIIVNTISTVDVTPTTLATLATVSNEVLYVVINILGYRTGGSSGNPGDSLVIERNLRVKNVAGSVTIPDNTTEFYSQDQSWSVNFIISGTNVLVQVTGANGNNIDWKSEMIVTQLG